MSIDDGWVSRAHATAGSEHAQRVFEKDGAERSLRLTRQGGRARLVLSERRVVSPGS